jgi:hypothetical protein
MIDRTRFGLFAAALLSTAIASVASAEIPRLAPLQTVEPLPEEKSDPDTWYTPAFGADVDVENTSAVAGMPGAYDYQGRAAVFTRNTAGTWTRTATLKASDAVTDASFGNYVAIAHERVLVASKNALYVFAQSSGIWQQTQQIWLPVQVLALAWNGKLAAVTVREAGGGTHVAVLKPDASGALQTLAVLDPPDALNSDRFGAAVAVHQSTVAASAPGYNSNQGAAYVFTCSTQACRQRQKLLSADGEPGDEFGAAIDLYGGLLVIGAPNVDRLSGPWPPSEQNPRASGAAYVFVQSTGTWVEQQKLRPTANESYLYGFFGAAVAVSGEEVLVSAPDDMGQWEPAQVFVYPRRSGSLAATHLLGGTDRGAVALAVSARTALVGVPAYGVYTGFATIYKLPR